MRKGSTHIQAYVIMSRSDEQEEHSDRLCDRDQKIQRSSKQIRERREDRFRPSTIRGNDDLGEEGEEGKGEKEKKGIEGDMRRRRKKGV